MTLLCIIAVREHLKVRQVLAQTRPADDSFAAMIAGMGKPKAVSTGRKKNTTVKKIARGNATSSGRFSIETNSSSEGDKTAIGEKSDTDNNGEYR